MVFYGALQCELRRLMSSVGFFLKNIVDFVKKEDVVSVSDQ